MKPDYNTKPISRNAAMIQVGWLGQSGAVYTMNTALSDIHKHEPASYMPLYIQIGEWEQNDKGEWYVEQD